MTVGLISFLHSWKGAARAVCCLCGKTVYEQQANLDRMAADGGSVICILCALELKSEFPEEFPAVDAQMWEGHVRAPQSTPQTQPLMDLLNLKSPRR